MPSDTNWWHCKDDRSHLCTLHLKYFLAKLLVLVGEHLTWEWIDQSGRWVGGRASFLKSVGLYLAGRQWRRRRERLWRPALECPDSGGPRSSHDSISYYIIWGGPRSPHHDQDADENNGLLFVGVCWASFMGFPGFLGLIGLLGFPGLPNEGDPEFFI